MNQKIIITVFSFLFAVTINSQSRSINEEKFVLIGGIEQWVTIKSLNTTKPVILFLHGGPGSTMSQYNEAMYGKWQADFILVNWDQRGAGRTFGRNAPADVNEDYWLQNPLTVEQMTADGIEITEYLLKHLGKQKLFIIGTSWGSVLGAKMALKKPDLFHAYIGHSQVVNASESLAQAYCKVFSLARKENDDVSLEKLISIGHPPYDDAKTTGQLFRIIKKYESGNSVKAPESWWILTPEYDNKNDSRAREDGDDFSFINYVGHKKLGIPAMSSSINFLKDDLEFKIPVYFIQGENDILTPKEITKKYFEKISAPKKEYILLPGAAHGHNQSVIDAQYKILKEYQFQN